MPKAITVTLARVLLQVPLGSGVGRWLMRQGPR
jgi:hypothetical protein